MSSLGFYSHKKSSLANVSLDTLRTCVQCHINSVSLTDPSFLPSLIENDTFKRSLESLLIAITRVF